MGNPFYSLFVMDHFNLSAKTLQKKLIGSLSLRIFYVALVLLILPLFLHTILMYRTEYKNKVQSLFSELSIIGESQKNYIAQNLSLHERMLKKIDENVDFEKEGAGNFFENDINQYLSNIASIALANEIFYLSYKAEDNLLCIATSDKKTLGENFSTKKEFFDSLKSNENYFFSPNKDILFITKTIFSKKTNSAAGLLVASFNPSYFIQAPLVIKDFPYNVEISVMSYDGKILVSSNKNLKDKKQGKDFFLSPIDFVKNGYFLTIGKEYHMAVKVSMGKSPSFLLIDVLKQGVIASLRKDYIMRFGILFCFLLIIGGGGCFWLIRKISKPLSQLVETMTEVAKGNVLKKYVPDKMGFEINLLGSFFNNVVEAMVKHQNDAEQHRIEKQIVAQELKLGHAIQKEMLPMQHPDFPTLDISTGYIPAKEVSGDFYDLFKKDDDHLMVVIADTSGKGISACFYSLNIRSIFRSFALAEDDLSIMIKYVNELFCQDTKDSGIFVTAWVGIFDKKTKQIKFANAGHYPAFVKRGNKLIELTTDGIAFGADAGQLINVDSFQLEKNDIFFLYTDGVIDTHNEINELYGKERLKDFLIRIKPKDSHEIVHSLMDDLNQFAVGQEQFDDITIVSLRLN